MRFADIDECQHGNGDCEQNCLNADGSYTCSCNVGFALAADGKRCHSLGQNSVPSCIH